MLSAFVLGVIFTTLPLSAYFSNHLFFVYLRNLVGDVQFLLPGVFTTNPFKWVNVSLWTVPFELLCYLAIVVLWFAGAVPRRRHLLLLLVVVMQLVLPLRDALSGNLIRIADSNLPGKMLVLAFLWAVVLFFFSHRIVLRAWLAVAAAAACYFMFKSTYAIYFVPLPAAYLTVFLGLTNPPKIPLLMSGDYSYGIYLYAAPIQQASIALFPERHEWWFNLATTLPLIGLFAAFSWHVVEKPILGRRKQIVTFIDPLHRRIASVINGIRSVPAR